MIRNPSNLEEYLFASHWMMAVSFNQECHADFTYVADRCYIGMGATILDRLRIGDKTLFQTKSSVRTKKATARSWLVHDL